MPRVEQADVTVNGSHDKGALGGIIYFRRLARRFDIDPSVQQLPVAHTRQLTGKGIRKIVVRDEVKVLKERVGRCYKGESTPTKPS